MGIDAREYRNSRPPPQQELYCYPSNGGPAWAAEAAAALDRLKQFAGFPPFIVASPRMLELLAVIWRARYNCLIA